MTMKTDNLGTDYLRSNRGHRFCVFFVMCQGDYIFQNHHYKKIWNCTVIREKCIVFVTCTIKGTTIHWFLTFWWLISLFQIGSFVGIFCLYLYLSVYFCILNSSFVLQHSGRFPVFWVSYVRMFTCGLSPSTTRVYISPFGYFRVPCSFSITSFSPRFLKRFLLLPYLQSLSLPYYVNLRYFYPLLI